MMYSEKSFMHRFSKVLLVSITETLGRFESSLNGKADVPYILFANDMALLSEPRHENIGFLNMRKRRRSAFVFVTRIVESLYFLNPKCQASSHLV